MKQNKLLISTLSDTFGGYYDTQDGSIQRAPGGKRTHGVYYKMNYELTPAQKKQLLSYTNVALFIVQSQYAPEQKHNSVFVF